MAHLSGDVGLVALFRSGADVFRTVAAQWLAKAPEAVSGGERANAKRLVYGLLYGMKARRLAAEIGWPVERARRELCSVQRAFPGLMRFRAAMERFCRETNHVTTIVGRQRWLPAIGSSSAAKRARARRQAFSTAVQGSAADIFRQALVRVVAVVRGINALHRAASGPRAGAERHPASGLVPPDPSSDVAAVLLCVHDEVLLEAREDVAASVVEQCREAMRSAVEGGLRVPLAVSASMGEAWSDL